MPLLPFEPFRRVRVALAVAISIACSAFACRTASAASADQVDAAIRKGVEYLYSKQRNGTWEQVDARPGDAPVHEINGGQWGGRTALITYALLASGESPADPRLKPAIDFLRKADIVGYYALGMRAQIYQFLPRNAENDAAAERDFTLLMRGIQRGDNPARGTFDYVLREQPRVDLSVTQYGVLGMWAVAQLDNKRIDRALQNTDFWALNEQAWLRYQEPTLGAWCYYGQPLPDRPYLESITTAGVASLFITQDYLHASQGVACRGNVTNAAIEKGINYLADRFAGIVGNGELAWRLYTLYGIERIGVASGLKYLKDVDWFAAGSDYLVRTQVDGRWPNVDAGEEINTAFALLFLSRGREPVMMNKLKYRVEPQTPRAAQAAPPQPTEGFWNQRPREVANVVRYVGKQTERTLNWQIVDLAIGTVRDLHDAPILYIAGGTPLNLPQADRAKLKAYVESGGMLVFNPDCRDQRFSRSIRDLLVGKNGLFPAYELKRMPTNHPIVAGQMFDFENRRLPPMSILSNGVRVLAVVFEDDLGRSWQVQETSRREHFELMADIFQYAVDKTHVDYKGRSYYVEPDPKVTPTRTIRVARLKHKFNYDPEPGGWRRLAAIFRNDLRIDLQIGEVELGAGDLAGYSIAHLTGTDRIVFEPAQVEQLKAFIARGGTLIVDAAGGSADFKQAIEAELGKLLPPKGKAELEALMPEDHPLFTAGGLKSPTISYRTYARNSLTGNLNRARLRAATVEGRLAVLYSSEDLVTGLVGTQADGIIGYSPQSAVDLMTRAVLYAADQPLKRASP